MRKTLIVTGIVALVLIAGFFVLNRYIYNQKQGQAEALERYRGTLTGEYVCLLPSGESSMKSDDCAYALKTDQGEYFVVDFALMSQDRVEIELGDRFSANGVITPIEMLSTDHWRQYSLEIEGIFSITDSVEIL